jgi:DNA-binding MarR family transcriptional regulator
MGRTARKLRDPDLGVLAAQLLFGLQEELFARMRELGFDDVSPRHGAVLAYLDEAGTRPGELARLSGRRKQTIGATLDELERLGYLRRDADPTDRRARLIVPTERGLAFMTASDQVVAEIERRHVRELGLDAYVRVKDGLRAIAAPRPEESAAAGR